MLPDSTFQSNLQRGEMLRQHGRFKEAETFLQAAITTDPQRAEGYYQLAFCYCNWPGHDKQALETVGRAIAMATHDANNFALRAWIYGNLDKYQESISAAEQALALDPTDLLALNAQTRARLGLCDWKAAEENARYTLSIWVGQTTAINFLAAALRRQGRYAECLEITNRLLALVPNNASAQASAGWTALESGDHVRANAHFLQALRLEPGNNHARLGLLHSFNSRVWFYRVYLQVINFAHRYGRSMRWVIVIIFYVIYRMVIHTLHSFGHEGVEWGLVVVAFYFILLGYGRSLANLFLMLDPFARHALTAKEKWSSLLPNIALGLLLLILALDDAWLQFAVLATIPACFLWAVLVPQLQNLFSRSEHVIAE